MSTDRPIRAVDAYKEIIDQLVNETTCGISERLVRQEGIYSVAQGEDASNSFVRSLSPEQREVLAGMLRGERISAIGGVLAVLTWWMSARGVALTFRGEAMPAGFEGGLHNDYIGRLSDWECPENSSPEA